MADIDAGRVSVSLGFNLGPEERAEFERFQQLKRRAEKDKRIEAELKADYSDRDRRVMDQYMRSLQEAERFAKRKEAFRAALGADFDSRRFARAVKKQKDAEDKLARDHEAALREYKRREKQARDAVERDHERALVDYNRREKKFRDDLDRDHARALAENIKREKRFRAEIEKAHGAAIEEDKRRARRMLRETRHETNLLGRAAKRTGNALRDMIPDVYFGTRIPVYLLAGLATAIQALLPPVLALAGALGPVTGLLAAIPTLAATAGGALTSALLGLRGVGDALGAAWEKQTQAGLDAEDQAEKVRTKTRQVQDAEERLADAHERVGDAQENLNETREEAEQRLQDMRMSLERLTLAQRENRRALAESQEELGRLLADPEADRRDIAAARDEIRGRELDLKETRQDSRRTQEELNEAEETGVKGMEEMVRAREQLAEANENASRAARDLRRAQRDAAKEMEEGGSSADKLEEKLAELSPAGRRFVRMMARDFFPMFKRLRNVTQEGLLPGLGRGLQEASKNFPVVRRMVASYSDALGDAAEKQGRLFGSRQQGQDFENIFGQGERFIRRAAEATTHWVRGLTNVSVAAEPLVDWLGRVNVRLSRVFEQWTEAGRETGRFERFFERTIRNTELLFGALWDFGAALIDIGAIGRRVWGQDMLQGIRDAAAEFREWTESMEGERSLTRWFRRWRRRWQSIVDWMGRVIGRYRDLKDEGSSSISALVTVMTEEFAELLVALAENAGEAAPKVALAFVRGFLNANVWGKLALGTFLLGRFGGRGAFVALGKRVGAWFGFSFAASAGAAAAGTGAAGGAAGGAAAGSFFSRFGAGLRIAAKRLGVIGVGVTVADGIVDAIDNRLKQRSGDIIEALEGIAGVEGDPNPFNWISRQFGVGDEKANNLLATLREIRDTGSQITFYRAGELRNLADALDITKNQKNLIADLLKAGLDDELSAMFSSIARAGKTDMSALRRTVERNIGLINTSLGGTQAGREAVEEHFGVVRRVILRAMRDGRLETSDAMRMIVNQFRTHSGAARGLAIENFHDIRNVIVNTMRRGGRVTEDGLAFIHEAFRIHLDGLGLGKPPKLQPLSKLRRQLPDPGDLMRGGGSLGRPWFENRAVGGFAGDPVEAAGGGLVGRWGERGRDMVHAILGRGEAVLNNMQQRVVNSALARAFGMRGLPDLFRRTRGSKHHMAEGGYADEQGHYARGGYVQGAEPPSGPGSGPIRNFANRLFGMGFNVTSGGEHRGTGTYHDQQRALDFGNSANNLRRLWSTLFPSRGRFAELFGPSAFGGLFQFGRRFSDAGLQADHEDHIHVALLEALRGALAPRIPRVLVGGPDSPLKALIQGGLDKVRRAAQRQLRGQSRAAPGGPGITVAPGGEFSKSELADLWTQAGGPPEVSNLMAAIALAESGGDPMARGPMTDFGFRASGLWQIHPPQEGWESPSANARMAVEKYNTQGLNAWEAFTNGSYAQFLASGGVVGGDGASIGDFMGLPFAGRFQEGGFATLTPYGGGFGGLTEGDREAFSGRGAIGRTRRFGKSTNRIITQLRGRIDRLEGDYFRWSDRFALSPDDISSFINEGDENTPPSINEAALAERTDELKKLISIQERIAANYERLVFYIDRLVSVYRFTRRRVRRAMRRVQQRLGRLKGRRGRKAGRQRKALRERLGTYRGAMEFLGGEISDKSDMLQTERGNMFDARTALMEDRQELSQLRPGVEARHGEAMERFEDRGPDEDARAQLAQERARRERAEEFMRVSQGAFEVFQGPGDIGAGAQYAYRAVGHPRGTPEGPGPGLGLELRDDGRIYPIGGSEPIPPGDVFGGSGGGTVVNVNTLHPGDPATLDAVGRAATAGQGLQSRGGGNHERVRV